MSKPVTRVFLCGGGIFLIDDMPEYLRGQAFVLGMAAVATPILVLCLTLLQA
jgi:hypothetical protein